MNVGHRICTSIEAYNSVCTLKRTPGRGYYTHLLSFQNVIPNQGFRKFSTAPFPRLTRNLKRETAQTYVPLSGAAVRLPCYLGVGIQGFPGFGVHMTGRKSAFPCKPHTTLVIKGRRRTISTIGSCLESGDIGLKVWGLRVRVYGSK